MSVHRTRLGGALALCLVVAVIGWATGVMAIVGIAALGALIVAGALAVAASDVVDRRDHRPGYRVHRWKDPPA